MAKPHNLTHTYLNKSVGVSKFGQIVSDLEEGAPVEKGKYRILIADPDPDIRETLRLYFEANNHEVREVAEATSILKTARAWQPHTILISAEFEDKKARCVCRELVDDTLTSHIPVIMLLHVNDRQSRLEALEVGVDDIITKPFDIEELLLRVEAMVRLSTTRKKISAS